MREFLQYVIDGLAEGSIYAMIALGYTLVYGIIKLINFAHGEFYMMGGYIGLFLMSVPLAATSSPWLFALIVILAVGGSAAGASVLAVVTERVAYRPVRGYNRIAALLTAIGVSFLLQNVARLAFSPKPRSFEAFRTEHPESCLAGFIAWYKAMSHPLGFEIQNAKILVVGVAAVSMVGLYFLVMRTRFGTAMRATSQDLEAARLMGIDTDGVISRTFALGGAFAGMAGILVGMMRIVDPMMGFMPGLKAFVAAVVGGIGSIPGAALGGLAIGLAESMAVFANLDTAYKDAVAFALLVIVLLVRPGGIMGVRRREKV